MDTITVVLSLAGAILSIILFFKVWSMTSNVKALKKHLVDNDSIRLNIRIALAKKTSDIEDLLFASMFKELSVVYYNNDSTPADFTKVIDDYKNYYERANIAFPAEFDNMYNSKFREYL